MNYYDRSIFSMAGVLTESFIRQKIVKTTLQGYIFYLKKLENSIALFFSKVLFDVILDSEKAIFGTF